MAENLDLNIDNYNLDELLELFHLSYDFTASDLKQAKRIVLKTHPDKSNLPKEYFLFFSKAYKIIFNIYEFRHKSKNQSTEYVVEKNDEHEAMLKKIQKKDNFNKWFNKMFEEHKITNDYESGGYGDWFKSEENTDNRKISHNEMGKVFEEKKAQIQDLIVRQEINDFSTSNGASDLIGEQPQSYASDMFGKLQYDDLKKAHTETVVPVTHNDYLSREKFNSVDELKRHRSQNMVIPSIEQSKDYLSQQTSQQSRSDVERAYKLAKQDELAQEMNKKWWGKVKQIRND